MASLSFIGRTAIVTGAGGGLGRLYALELAKRGCNVLVNDVGCAMNGESSSRIDPAGIVAAEIIAQGGRAVANRSSVVDGASIVDHALKEFGSCDILINNAGILRDKTFAKMTKSDWDEVLAVHLGGTFALCHAAWPVMQKQNYGRIVNSGSVAGLYGNFGQTNYSTAKMGIFGITNSLAKEGGKANINVNIVVPIAATRMTETVLDKPTLDRIDPAHVVPMVTYLAHDSNNLTGKCYEVGGGSFAEVRFQRSAGRSLGDKHSPASAEQIANNIRYIGDFTKSTNPTSPAEALLELMAAIVQ